MKFDISAMVELAKTPAFKTWAQARSMCDEAYGTKRLKPGASEKELSQLKTDACTNAVIDELEKGESISEVQRLLDGSAGKGYIIAGAVAAVALVGAGWYFGSKR